MSALLWPLVVVLFEVLLFALTVFLVGASHTNMMRKYSPSWRFQLSTRQRRRRSQPALDIGGTANLMKPEQDQLLAEHGNAARIGVRDL